MDASQAPGLNQELAGQPLDANSFSADAFASMATQDAVDSEPQAGQFVPRRPESLEEAGLQLNDLFPLILKYLFLHGNRSGHQLSKQLKMPFDFIVPAMDSLKSDLLVVHKASAGMMTDYEYELTPKGVEQARIHLARSTYCGAAPVSIAEYKNAVLRQSIRNLKPRFKDVASALSDLEVTELTINQMGQAINSGKSMFLFGAPGNGKTSLAKRAINAIGNELWIPRAITVGGEVIRMFDPSVHKPLPLPETTGLTDEDNVDHRWIRIERPTIVVGGELEMKHLEATLNPVTGIIEAPIHVKSNCGCLVVDDFGRQQISATELLNRWIVPMESGNDYLNLPSGRQVSLPFDQFLIFSTNLEPSTLCDEAFLRRIPYKVEVFDPSETQFRRLFIRELETQGFDFEPAAVDQVIEYHYKRVGRSFRFCHAVDLIDQCRDFCDFHGKQLQFNRDIAELAVLNYFAGMDITR